MSLYYEDASVTLYLGDSFDVLRLLPDASVDAGVTDPPYELAFMGKAWDGTGIAFSVTFWREVNRVLKPGAHLLACGGTRTYHRMASAIEDAGFEVRDCLAWLYGSGFPKSLNLGGGLGTALKPAYEPIVLARKPFKGTVAANVAAHGTGALNIDACRVSYQSDGDFESAKGGDSGSTMPDGPTYAGGWGPQKRQSQKISRDGRWPANVALDEHAALVLDEQSGEAGGGFGTAGGKVDHAAFGGGMKNRGDVIGFGDVGGASRFYYVAKPSREERDFGTAGLLTRQRDDSRKEGNVGGDNPRNRGLQQRGNFHPTVKPVELMRWLVRLVTPINGVVLDPFLGSGTTGMAAKYEQRRFLGIERDADYMQIAERRIRAVAPLFAVGATPDAVDPVEAVGRSGQLWPSTREGFS